MKATIFAIDLFSTAEQYVLHETQSAKTAVCVTSVLKLYEVTMNKIKLLALDLDGTTLTSKNTLTPAVNSALEKAIANGITVAVAMSNCSGSVYTRLQIASGYSALSDSTAKMAICFLSINITSLIV